MNANPWVLSPAECQQNEGQFLLLQPANGLISGDQARPFFLKSGLPPNLLAQIWQLADLNKDGKLDCLEFFIAMRLVRNCLSGIPLPSILPESLKQLPLNRAGSSFPQYHQPMSSSMPAMQPQRPMSAYGGTLPANYGNVKDQFSTPASYSAQNPTSSAFVMGIKELGDWSIPQHLKLRFSQQFNLLDRNRIGLLTGAQSRGVLGESQLPSNILAQIWAMADVNKSGCLSIEQFCVAMFLIEMVKSGFALPASLPQELSTFCHRSKTASPLADPTQPPPQKSAPLKTFEDKRRDNLDRGQAELERRRQILREEEERRRAEIERKEREEEERKERERQELEKRRDAEREAERQREMERERERAAEEERIKLEREEARRRLEQDRIKELEKIRIRDLETQHQNELEKTTQFQQRHKTMTFQLQAMEEKSQQLGGEISNARDEIISITSEIERMRESRDQKMGRIDELQARSQQLAVQCQRIGHENLQLQSECQRTLCRTQEIENAKKQIVERDESIVANEEELRNAKERLASQEKQVEAKRPEFEENKNKLRKVVEMYNKLVDKFCIMKEEAEKRLSPKQSKKSSKQEERALYALPPDAGEANAFDSAEMPVNATSSASGFDSDFGANFAAAFPNQVAVTSTSANQSFLPLYSTPPDMSQTTAVIPAQNANGATPKAVESFASSNNGATTTRYRALYEFIARSDDELSLQPGDTILVFENHASEPGWLAGQIKDKVGWFPAAFAERIQTAAAVALKTQNSSSIPTSPSAEPLESIKEEPIIEKEFVADFSVFGNTSKRKDSGKVSNGTNGINFPTAEVVKVSAPLYDAPPGDISSTVAAMKLTEDLHQKEDELILATGVALYQWKARNDTELTFSRNEVIEILEQGEMRWRGRLQKKPEQQGWFPKSYVKLNGKSTPVAKSNENKKDKTISAQSSVISNSTETHADAVKSSITPVAATPAVAKNDDAAKGSKNGSDSGVEMKEQELGELYVAMYQFDAVEPTDLSLKPGDMIQIIEAKDEWWKGTCNGKSGIFPANYVQKASSLRPQGKESVGKALAAFEATGPNQISLRVGELVRIHSTSPGGWWEGEVDHDGTKLSGWFPGNYIQVLNEDEVMTPSKDGITLAAALFDYDAQHADELTFKAGDVLQVVDTSGGQWWKGRHNKTSDVDTPPLLFPANFVQL